jgi:hypothetical protein
METKLTREYAEKLANEANENTAPLGTEFVFVNGYMKAIEETNAKGLLEAVQNAIKDLKRPHSDGSIALGYLEAAIKKSSI